jgi:hypothetical protein
MSDWRNALAWRGNSMTRSCKLSKAASWLRMMRWKVRFADKPSEVALPSVLRVSCGRYPDSYKNANTIRYFLASLQTGPSWGSSVVL